MKFLNTPSVGWLQKTVTILCGFAIMWAWMIFTYHLVHYLWPPPPGYVPMPDDPEMEPPVKYLFFFTIIWAPIWEELFHRHAFGLLAKNLGNKYLLPIMILSSVIFAQGHGQVPLQIAMLNQGVGGFILFYVYVKNGYSPLSSIIMHMAWNVVIFFNLSVPF